MNPWAFVVLAVAGGAVGVVIANIVITVRNLGDMQDVWGDDEDM